jgi:hypothetical protein
MHKIAYLRLCYDDFVPFNNSFFDNVFGMWTDQN